MFIIPWSATFLVAFLLSLLQSTSNALKCKCTQSSPKVPCDNGVCEVPTASSSCLMLDHPNSGLHYACSTNANLSEGECVSKISKSGANVKVCSCFSSDFCNFKIWPGGQEVPEEDDEHADEIDDNDDDDEENAAAEKAERRANSADSPRRLLLVQLFFGIFSCLLITFLPPFRHFLLSSY